MSNNVHILNINNEYSANSCLKRLKVASAGIGLMSPKCIHHCIKLENVDKRAANILKQEMLALGGEAALPWEAFKLTSENCNVILIGNRKHFLLLIKKLARQPFKLDLIGNQIKEILENYQKAKFIFKARNKTIELAKRTLIMGVINVTPDSFSGDGIYGKPQVAIDYALKMLDQGADMIDIGGESTRPGGAKVIPFTEELDRVLPVVKGLRKKTSALISVDTYKHEVAKEVLAEGVDIINDITGTYYDAKILPLIKKYKAGLIIMHSPNPPSRIHQPYHYNDLLSEIISYLRKAINKASATGIEKESVVIDPGIGFGKTVNENFLILNNLMSLKSLGYPILIGTSRKSFIGKTINKPENERLFATCATVAVAIINGANIIRVHDVSAIKEVAVITDKIKKNGYKIC